MSHGLTAVAPPPPPPPPTSLAPGFRFHPSDEELVMYYLRRKVCALPFRFQAVAEIDVYKSEPWELAGFSPLNSRDREWYFFSPVDKKYGNGSRLNRATGQGYWKATGKDRVIRHKEETIGLKKTLVYHTDRAPGGKRTDWVMHEYRLSDHQFERARAAQDAFVLCRIFEKGGLGPPTGHRYAPYLEEEWQDDAALVVPGGEADDETTNGEGTRNDVVQVGAQNVISKRKRLEDLDLNSEPELETLPLSNKRLKESEPSSSNDKSSEDSVTTVVDTRTTYFTSKIAEFPELVSIAADQANRLATISSFGASALEKSVPTGYLKFLGKLEDETVNASMKKETWKIEVMRAQTMIKILQSRVNHLTAVNCELRRADK